MPLKEHTTRHWLPLQGLKGGAVRTCVLLHFRLLALARSFRIVVPEELLCRGVPWLADPFPFNHLPKGDQENP